MLVRLEKDLGYNQKSNTDEIMISSPPTKRKKLKVQTQILCVSNALFTVNELDNFIISKITVSENFEKIAGIREENSYFVVANRKRQRSQNAREFKK